MEVYSGEKYYHQIPGLMVPFAEIDHEEITSDINSFIKNVPDYIETIEININNTNIDKQRATFIKNIEILRSFMNKVYAREMEADAIKLLQYVKNEYNKDQIEGLILPFLQNLLSLISEMKSAQTIDRENDGRVVRESSVQTSSPADLKALVLKNLSIIMNSIDDSEFDTAQMIAIRLMKNNPSEEGFVELLDLINEKEYIKAKNMIIKLRTKYNAL